MKALLAALTLSLLVLPVHAQEKKEPSAAQKKQQERMASCNKQAGSKGMKGDERKAFMSDCLKDPGPSAAQKKQQDRMASCNKEAGGKGLKGDDRKKFMSSCLKG
jgi:hypothetical protein